MNTMKAKGNKMIQKIQLTDYLTGDKVKCYLLENQPERGYYDLRLNYGLEWVKTFWSSIYEIRTYERKDGQQINLAYIPRH